MRHAQPPSLMCQETPCPECGEGIGMPCRNKRSGNICYTHIIRIQEWRDKDKTKPLFGESQ